MTDPTPTPSDPNPNPAPASAATPVPAPSPAPIPAPDPAPAPVAGDPPPVAGDPPPDTGGWPADWRQKYSADPTIQKRLERYGSPKAAIDALFAAQTRISKGDLLPTLKENATPEEIADYRAAHGIPDSPAGYDLALPNGLVIGESDKPMVDEFLAAAHAQHMHPKLVQETLGWYFDKQEQALAAQESRDTEARMACLDKLREDFGPEYKKEVKVAMAVLEMVPEDVRDNFLGGRLANGTLIGNDPSIIRWLNSLSRELNPLATVAPGSGTNAAQAVETELGNLRKMMGDHKSDYWKGPMAAKHQARYKELIGAQQTHGRRAA